MSTTSSAAVIPHVLYAGDSDIARWPLPDVSSTTYEPTLTSESSRLAKSGWTAGDMLEQLKSMVTGEALTLFGGDGPSYVVVCTVGENDVESSSDDPASLALIVDKIMEGMDLLSNGGGESCAFKGALFFGPKIEPWMFADPLDVDVGAILAHARLSTKIAARFEERPNFQFVDCLGMFCDSDKSHTELLMEAVAKKGDGGAVGAQEFSFTVGTENFNDDLLHLSVDGYGMWDDIVRGWIETL